MSTRIRLCTLIGPIVTSLLCLVLSASAVAQVESFQPRPFLVISDNTSVLVGKTLIARLTPGDVVSATRERGPWLWVDLGNVSGWVRKEHVLPQSKALQMAADAVGRDEKDPGSRVTRGLVWYAQGEHEKAIADFSEAIRLQADLARAYANRGNAWAAKGELQRAIVDYDSALKLAPRDALTLNNRAVARIEQGEYDNAIADLTSAIRHYRPQAVTVEVDAKQPSKAKARLWVVRYFIHRGLARERTGDFGRALADYSEAVRLDATDPAAHFNRANALFQQLQFDRAIEGYSQALALERDDARAYRNRGWARFHSRQFAKAADDFQNAIRLDPQNPIAYDALAWLLATCPTDGLRSGEKALELANKACELTGRKNASYLETLAAAYAELGRYDDAVAWQRKALDQVAETDRVRAGARLEQYESRRPLRHEPLE